MAAIAYEHCQKRGLAYPQNVVYLSALTQYATRDVAPRRTSFGSRVGQRRQRVYSRMRSGTIAFAVGVALLLSCQRLPDTFYLQLLPLCVLCAWRVPGWRLPALLLSGFLCALLHVSWVLRPVLPEQAVGQDLRVEGLVASITSTDSVRRRFIFLVDRFEAPAASVVGLPRTLRVRLDWYGASPRLVPGDRWRLTVRLKPPHGFINPGSFDYETWLFRERIRATGYVRADPDNARLESTPAYLVHRLRQRILLATCYATDTSVLFHK